MALSSSDLIHSIDEDLFVVTHAGAFWRVEIDGAWNVVDCGRVSERWALAMIGIAPGCAPRMWNPLFIAAIGDAIDAA
jgi:hypothetical protein